MNFGQSSLGIGDALAHEQRLMNTLAAVYVGRERSEEILPPYITSLQDTYALSMALKAEEARVLHKDIYVLGEDTIFLALLMNARGVSMYCATPAP